MIINLRKIKSIFIIILSLIFILVSVTATSLAHTAPKIKLPILMYHHMTVGGEFLGAYCINVYEFKNDLEYIKKNDYTPILTADLINYETKGTPLPIKPIMITFDDGYESTYTYAYPLLKQYHMKAIISVIGKYTDDYSAGQDLNPLYAYITWKQTKELTDSKIFEVQNHSYDMHQLNGKRYGSGRIFGESETLYSEALTNDLAKTQKKIIEATGVPPTSFTYPFGKISKEALPVLKSMGFKAAFTCREKVNYLSHNKDELFSLCRYNRPHGTSTWSIFRHF